MATPVTGQDPLNSAAASGAVDVSGPFNFALWSVAGFVGTAQLERSFDNGSTWLPVTLPDGPVATKLTWTGTGAANETLVDTVLAFPENLEYRVNVTAWTSGALAWRISA
jgi:hypothetical protein